MEVKKRKKLIGNILLLIVVVFLMLLILESVNYVVFSKNKFYSVWPLSLNKTFIPNSSVLHGIEGESHFTINKLEYVNFDWLESVE